MRTKISKALASSLNDFTSQICSVMRIVRISNLHQRVSISMFDFLKNNIFQAKSGKYCPVRGFGMALHCPKKSAISEK